MYYILVCDERTPVRALRNRASIARWYHRVGGIMERGYIRTYNCLYINKKIFTKIKNHIREHGRITTDVAYSYYDDQSNWT